jgi:hypothetical protein
MRKPRDFDSELKALADKAKQLKERRVQQLGELVIATGADATDAETLAGALLVIADTTDAGKKEAWRKRGAAFFQSKARNVATELKASRTALSRLTAARHRLEAAKARTDMREWQVKRRERTRQLIELGGLVVKAGLVELADDDRATLYGAFLTVAAKLRGDEREQALVLWKRKGQTGV